MKDPGIQISEDELNLIRDVDFLKKKTIVLEKIKYLFSDIQSGLKEYIDHNPGGPEYKHPGKISRGENYQHLPYLVLDYPSIFSQPDIFALRTMFWWGHFFSVTLHLQGKFLVPVRHSILEKIVPLQRNEIYISVGTTPWEYHYNPDNYEIISLDHRQHIRQAEFLKLSKKFRLESFSELPGEVIRFYQLMTQEILPH